MSKLNRIVKKGSDKTCKVNMNTQGVEINLKLMILVLLLFHAKRCSSVMNTLKWIYLTFLLMAMSVRDIFGVHSIATRDWLSLFFKHKHSCSHKLSDDSIYLASLFSAFKPFFRLLYSLNKTRSQEPLIESLLQHTWQYCRLDLELHFWKKIYLPRGFHSLFSWKYSLLFQLSFRAAPSLNFVSSNWH